MRTGEHCLRRWHLVPGKTPGLPVAPGALPFAFEFDTPRQRENVNTDEEQAFFSDALPTQQKLYVGDRVQLLTSDGTVDEEQEGIIREIYMMVSESGTDRLSPKGAQTTEELAQITRIKVEFELDEVRWVSTTSVGGLSSCVGSGRSLVVHVRGRLLLRISPEMFFFGCCGRGSSNYHNISD